jgi:hypothetical protein
VARVIPASRRWLRFSNEMADFSQEWWMRSG